jgi:speckle-type POZ protein
MSQLYESSEETSDVVFAVGGKEFPAHKCILSLRAKTIYELVKDYNKNDTDDDEEEKMVPIQDMESDVLGSVLECIYCVRTPEIKDKYKAIKLLLAADRLGCTDLKLFVESTIVEKILDASDAANWLVFSDSHSCPLLKEASMKVYDADADTVMESKEGWSKIKDSPRLLEELLKFCRMKEPPVVSDTRTRIDSNNNHFVDILDVTSFRERLFKANLCIDGNREILVERLKEHHLVLQRQQFGS